MDVCRRLTAALAVALLGAALPACNSGDGTGTGTATTAAAPTWNAPVTASPTGGSGADAAAVREAAEAFLDTLDVNQRQAAAAERTQANLSHWSDLPDLLFKRAGVRMDSLSAPQRDAALKILRSALSDEGYRQVTQITAADGVLAEQGGMNLDLGADHYRIRVLGTPATGKWTVQYGGHHLALNITMSGGSITLAPTLWGAQPASFTEAGGTVEPLGGETRKAFALVGSLDATQLKAAVLTTPIREIALGAGHDGQTLAAAGVKASTFTEKQRALLVDLLTEWLGTLTPAQARANLEAAQEHLTETTFAWYGATKAGNPVYYRVQGPTFIIEFAHQQGQGANAGGVTHIHSIYREPGNDYAGS